jgi:hypothetical protein
MNENTASTTTPKNFYRPHTFAERGPDAGERAAYLQSISILLPHPQGKEPLSHAEIASYFTQQRASRFPEQHRMAQEIRTKKAMHQHEREKATRAKR